MWLERLNAFFLSFSSPRDALGLVEVRGDTILQTQHFSLSSGSLSSSELETTSLSTFLGGLIGLGRYGQQPIRYVFDTDLADTIRIRYETHVHN